MKSDTRSQAVAPSLTVTLDPHALAAQFAGLYLSGQGFVRAKNTYPLHNPATRQPIVAAASCDASEVHGVIQDAVAAQAQWAQVPASERGRIVAAAADAVEAHKEELARLMALETGKALRTESRGEAMVATQFFRFYAGLALEIKGETVPYRPDMWAITKREPIGVVGAILPWNAPIALMSAKAAPALVAGNAVVVKAAEEAPLTVLRMVQILNTVLPPGLLTVLCGDGPTTGEPLVKHPSIKKITFTGSVETGKIISRNAADKLVPVTLELGGKSPMIVMADADLEQAVEGALGGMRFTRQGQSCSASSRIFVHESLIEIFAEKLRLKVNTLVMGDPLDEKTDIGTIISKGQFDKVKQYLDAGRALPGVTTITCTELPQEEALKNGYFLQPTLFVGVSNDAKVAREEIFGPVACLIPFSDYEQALREANDSDYGLMASIWTRNLATALDAADRLEAGYVQINQSAVAGLGLPYGGYKQSGLGKEFSLDAMIQHFTREKTILINKKA